MTRSHFLDSGAFTLKSKAARHNRTDPYAYYDTKEFWEYADRYIKFLTTDLGDIDLYANLDVIPNPELTWRNQQYLERHGLSPVPVVHCGTDLKWLKKYMNSGYDLIGLGGLVATKGKETWLDSAFNIVCDQPSRLPKVRIHGFGVTSCELMLRYPWWSVDSTSWAKFPMYGLIIVPRRRGGRFVFSESPHSVRMAPEVREGKCTGATRYLHSPPGGEIRKAVDAWLDYIEVPLGKYKDDINPKVGGEVAVPGVVTDDRLRKYACLRYFEEMRKHLPDWPWPWYLKSKGNACGGFLA